MQYEYTLLVEGDQCSVSYQPDVAPRARNAAFIHQLLQLRERPSFRRSADEDG